MKKSLLIAAVLCFATGLMAQEEKENEDLKGVHPYKLESDSVSMQYAHWSIIPHVGFNMFDGDFRSEMQHAISYPSAGLAFEYSFTPDWSLGVQYMFDWYKVTGKPGGHNADVLLEGMIHKANAYLSLDLINLFFPRWERKLLGLQPMIGGGYSWYKNSIMYDDVARSRTAEATPKAMEKYEGVAFFNFGFNLEFNLNRTLSLGLRATYDYFVNDYVDGRGYRTDKALASKNNDGVMDVTLNLRIKLQAVPDSHVRNFNNTEELEKKYGEPECVAHDTVIIRHDSIIIREEHSVETIRQIQTKDREQVYYIYFANNKSNLDDKALITIQQVADRLEEDPSLYAVVTGFCDNTGSAQHNYVLGDKRADNVINELVEEHAVDSERMYAMGMGKLIGRRSQTSYGPNRRAVIRLVDEATFLRMKMELDDKRANREVDAADYLESDDWYEEGDEYYDEYEEDSKPAVKTIPLTQSARPAKVNQYKQRTNEQVVTEKSTTLSKLARQYYNNTYCWVYIYIANKDKISNPNAIIPGTKLIIPELTQKEMEITKDESLVLYGNARQQR